MNLNSKRYNIIKPCIKKYYPFRVSLISTWNSQSFTIQQRRIYSQNIPSKTPIKLFFPTRQRLARTKNPPHVFPPTTGTPETKEKATQIEFQWLHTLQFIDFIILMPYYLVDGDHSKRTIIPQVNGVNNDCVAQWKRVCLTNVRFAEGRRFEPCHSQCRSS